MNCASSLQAAGLSGPVATKILRYVYRVGRRDSDDLIQEICLRLLVKRAVYKPDHIGVLIAKGIVRDAMRRKRTRRKVVACSELGHVAANSDESMLLVAMRCDLDQKERSLLISRLEGQTFEALAAERGVHPTTIGRWCQNAVERIV